MLDDTGWYGATQRSKTVTGNMTDWGSWLDYNTEAHSWKSIVDNLKVSGKGVFGAETSGGAQLTIRGSYTGVDTAIDGGYISYHTKIVPKAIDVYSISA